MLENPAKPAPRRRNLAEHGVQQGVGKVETASPAAPPLKAPQGKDGQARHKQRELAVSGLPCARTVRPCAAAAANERLTNASWWRLTMRAASAPLWKQAVVMMKQDGREQDGRKLKLTKLRPQSSTRARC